MDKHFAILIVLILVACSDERATTTNSEIPMIGQCFQIDRNHYQPGFYCHIPNCSYGIGCTLAGGEKFYAISYSYILDSQDSVIDLGNGSKDFIPQFNWPVVELLSADTLSGSCETQIIISRVVVNFESGVGFRLGCDTSRYLQFRKLDGYELFIDLVPESTVSYLWSKDESSPNTISLIADSSRHSSLYFNRLLGLIDGKRLFQRQYVLQGWPNWQVLSTMLVLETIGIVYWEQQHIGSEDTWLGSESFVRYVADSMIQKQLCMTSDSLPIKFPCSGYLVK